MDLLFPLVLLGLMWLLLVRPQQQRVRRQRELVASLGVGDRVVTVGGLLGTIVALTDEEARLEVAPGTVLTVLRPAISSRFDEEEGAG
ncbi:MAG TPA: preprotein translocase subunit YajC [Acidimicrobiales bacterium]|nr:preprotein translocase subunit YajC [Acidimicrobiales bacterium]